MDIQKKDLGELVSLISITVQPGDYNHKFEQKLNQMAQKASIKGFRKGKTPATVIKKMYGESVFAELIDEMFNNAVSTYLKENKIRYIAQPMLSASQEKLVLEVNNPKKSYTINYEIGEIPDFELIGASDSDHYTAYMPIPKEDFVDTEMMYLARRLGKMEEVSEIIGEELITVAATELEDGEVKEGGVSKDVILFYASIADEGLKASLMGKKIDDNFQVEVSKLENKDMNFIKKNLFGLDENYDLKEDAVFNYHIKKIMRLKPAELTEELIKQQFNFDTREELVVEIEKSFHQSYKPNSRQLLKKAVMDHILASTKIQISETFVRNWLKQVEQLDEEKIEKELSLFIDELKWTYIKDELAKKHDIKINNDDIRNIIADRIMNYERNYGKLPKETVDKLLKDWYSDRTEMFKISEEAKSNKVFDKLFEIIKIDEQLVPMEEFEKMFSVQNQ